VPMFPSRPLVHSDLQVSLQALQQFLQWLVPHLHQDPTARRLRTASRRLQERPSFPLLPPSALCLDPRPLQELTTLFMATLIRYLRMEHPLHCPDQATSLGLVLEW
jgi:hypothetical protein